MSHVRIGQGYDVHRYGPGDHVTLCGVRIPHAQGIVAHSDGDIPLHALCDALLGALALGDIGRHFPDTDPRWKGADSRDLLRAVVAMIAQRGWAVGNVDLTVVAEAPRISPHVAQMQANVAADLGVAADCVGIKATTNERMGFIGRGEGVAALAVALLVRAGP